MAGGLSSTSSRSTNASDPDADKGEGGHRRLDGSRRRNGRPYFLAYTPRRRVAWRAPVGESMWQLLRPYAAAAGVAGIAPHDHEAASRSRRRTGTDTATARARVSPRFSSCGADRRFRKRPRHSFFQNQDQRIERANSRDGIGCESWWRWGKTGRVQSIGSAVLPRARKSREGDKSIRATDSCRFHGSPKFWRSRIRPRGIS